MPGAGIEPAPIHISCKRNSAPSTLRILSGEVMMAKIDEIINGLAIECVCPVNLLPETPTEKSMVRLFNEFGTKLLDRLVENQQIRIIYPYLDVEKYYKDDDNFPEPE